MPEGATGRMPWHGETSWEAIEPLERPGGIISRHFVLGKGDEVDAPTVFRTYFPPGTVIEPHTHDCDYAEIILAGSQQVTRRWYRAGDIRIVKAGTVYGPLVAGPEGATVLLIFTSTQWAPRYAKARAPEASAEGL